MTSATLERALLDYERHRLHERNRSLRTWAGEKPGLRQLLDHMGEHTHDGGYVHNADRICEIGESCIASWWANLNVADSTRGTRLSQARTFLRYCAQRQWIAKDPTWMLDAPQLNPEPRERLDATELLEMLESAPYPADRIVLALAMNLAVRAGEIRRLTLRNVNLVEGTIRVVVDKTHEVDDMPISADLDVELRRWLTHYHGSCPDLDGDSPLVPAQYVSGVDGVPRYRPRPVGEPEDVVKRALRRLGRADHKEGVHTVRRSMARLYFDMIEAEETFDSAMLATMTLLHHDRPETTLRYIGRDRMKLARDRVLKGRPFVSRLAQPAVTHLRSVQ